MPEQAECKSCGKQMTPRVTRDDDGYEKAVCPLCGAPYKAPVSMALWVWILLIGIGAYEMIAIIRFYLNKP